MWLWLELVLVFFVVPAIIYLEYVPTRLSIPLLVLAAMGAAMVAKIHHADSLALGLAPQPAQTQACLIVGVGAWLLAQGAFALWRVSHGQAVFPFAASRPGLFLLIVGVYSISVTAQEFLFRGFFFWRYGAIASPVILFLVNVLVFAWVHIVFRSWISVIVTAVGGAFFTALYVRYPSLLGVSIVHMMFGLSIFAMGYGRYFFTGSISVARRIALAG